MPFVPKNDVLQRFFSLTLSPLIEVSQVNSKGFEFESCLLGDYRIFISIDFFSTGKEQRDPTVCLVPIIFASVLTSRGSGISAAAAAAATATGFIACLVQHARGIKRLFNRIPANHIAVRISTHKSP